MKMRSRRATCGGRCLSVLSCFIESATGMGFVLEFDDMCFKLLTSMCARARRAGLSAPARAAVRERQRALLMR